MRISVLLPTRDRLDLLSHAVQSVTRLHDTDYEIVISDNCSSGDVEGYVTSLNNSCIRYVRTPRFLSAAENWNNALRHSTGDYIIMLGDDDALLGGYFTRTRQLIADFGEPQVIYHNALLYTYPGVVSEAPDGELQGYGYAPFLRNRVNPSRVPATQARQLVRRAAYFQSSYGFNIQFVTISRTIIDAPPRHEEFFGSPFPDYYAMNYLFARASSIVAEPHPLVVIGLSTRSHGFFCHHNREAEGKAFLEGDKDSALSKTRARLLPGTHINDGWLLTFESLYRRLGCPADFKPSYRRYRMLQILHVYDGGYLRHRVGAEQLAELKQSMSLLERVIYGALFAALSSAIRVLPAPARVQIPRVLTLIARQIPWWRPAPDPSRYGDITEVVERIDDDDPARWGVQLGSPLVRRILERVFP
jgi:glycosyltransferase involved in cell wall biosynthesis